MSANSRSRKVIELPIAPSDFIIHMQKSGDMLLVFTNENRAFKIERVARYKRAYKCHEVTHLMRPTAS